MFLSHTLSLSGRSLCLRPLSATAPSPSPSSSPSFSSPSPLLRGSLLRCLSMSRPLHTSPSLSAESVEDVRRRIFAEKNAKEFRKEINAPDRTIGVAHAELELEQKLKMIWKMKNGKITDEELAAMEKDKEEMIAEGIDPEKGRWGEYLKRKRFVKKRGEGYLSLSLSQEACIKGDKRS
eukprot:TRINITY_DN325_c0_g1_i1.p1 TRINITY_DN325_c0_g1~~TRINITY_DN325_c0_g1_i1.p1  ORF type:complete len:179 (-),score=56.71 TRINITY_DN325_c0_g1_i1:549-1085(-)